MSAKYILKRVFYSGVILFIVISLNFFLPRLIFNDPAEPYLRGISEDEVLLRQEIRREYGFDGPVYKQYLYI